MNLCIYIYFTCVSRASRYFINAVPSIYLGMLYGLQTNTHSFSFLALSFQNRLLQHIQCSFPFFVILLHCLRHGGCVCICVCKQYTVWYMTLVESNAQTHILCHVLFNYIIYCIRKYYVALNMSTAVVYFESLSVWIKTMQIKISWERLFWGWNGKGIGLIKNKSFISLMLEKLIFENVCWVY